MYGDEAHQKVDPFLIQLKHIISFAIKDNLLHLFQDIKVLLVVVSE